MRRRPRASRRRSGRPSVGDIPELEQISVVGFGTREGRFEVARFDQLGELGRARHVRAFADVHKVRLRRDGQRLQTAQAEVRLGLLPC